MYYINQCVANWNISVSNNWYIIIICVYILIYLNGRNHLNVIIQLYIRMCTCMYMYMYMKGRSLLNVIIQLYYYCASHLFLE